MAFYLFDNIIAQTDENNKVRHREEQLLLQQSQYKSIISGYDQVKKVKHDMLGHLIALGGYLENDRMDDAKSYIRQLHHEINFTKRGSISGNVAVDAVINNRIAFAEKDNITIVSEAALPKEMCIDDLDMSVLIGNLLTNAIEACQRLEDKSSKRVYLGIKYRRSSLIIIVRNSFNPNSIKVSDGKYISSKSHRSGTDIGIGIANIETVVERYGGLSEIKIENDEFVTKIIIPDRTRKSKIAVH